MHACNLSRLRLRCHDVGLQCIPPWRSSRGRHTCPASGHQHHTHDAAALRQVLSVCVRTCGGAGPSELWHDFPQKHHNDQFGVWSTWRLSPAPQPASSRASPEASSLLLVLQPPPQRLHLLLQQQAVITIMFLWHKTTYSRVPRVQKNQPSSGIKFS